MKVAINCWVLRNKQLDGIGYFTVNTISRIIKAHPEDQFLILCDKHFTEDYFELPNVRKYRLFPALRHPLLYIFYMECRLPLFLRKHRPDVFVSADGFLSLSSGCKQLPIIYDINFEHRPEDLRLKNRIYFRYFFKRFVRKASRIATISEFSKRDIGSFYGIDSEKIDNVSCGISSNFSPLHMTEVNEIRSKWSAGKQYFFFVGSMHPRKNIVRLIEAFTLFKKHTGSDVKLLLAGSILWQKTAIEQTYADSDYKADIVFTGRLSDYDLQKVLGASLALTFVPVFEGFGLPIVEAMQCGVPIICSNVTSMPEVAGEATLLVDPYNVEQIAEAMERLFTDKVLQNQLIEKGYQQKQHFSWDKTAGLLWNSISLVASEK